MKKLLALFIISILITSFNLLGCKSDNEIHVYTPDGAPAIALTPAMDKGLDGAFFHVIDSQTIGSVVTGENPEADVCVLPINMASNLIGDGQDYKLLGTITHGNFYFLSNSQVSLNRDNLQSLVGKTVGVIQLKNIPGLTFKSVLLDNQIPYAEVKNLTDVYLDKVNLIGISVSEIGRSGIDVFLVPSPQADISSNANGLNFIGGLQDLYGENGFPQAVIVAKTSVIQNNQTFINEFTNALLQADDFFAKNNLEKLCSLVSNNLQNGLTPIFTTQNLTVKMVERSSIRFVSAKDCKEEIKAFISKIKSVDNSSVKTLNDSFFYE